MCSSDLVYGDGSKYATTAAGSAGQILTSNGASAPSWQDAPTPSKAGGALIVNTDVVTASYVLPSGSNAISVGPITIADTYSVTVSSGQRWVVI